MHVRRWHSIHGVMEDKQAQRSRHVRVRGVSLAWHVSRIIVFDWIRGRCPQVCESVVLHREMGC